MTITNPAFSVARNSFPQTSNFSYKPSYSGRTITINTTIPYPTEPKAPSINEVHSAAFFDSWADEWGDDEDYPA